MGKAERPSEGGETQANRVSNSAEQDGGCSTCEMGESERSEKSGVTTAKTRLADSPAWTSRSAGFVSRSVMRARGRSTRNLCILQMHSSPRAHIAQAIATPHPT